MVWFAVTAARVVKSAFVYDLKIREDLRRKGYGGKVMERVEELVQEMGIDTVGLHVMGYNHAARALYEKMGYQITGIGMTKTLEKRLPPLLGVGLLHRSGEIRLCHLTPGSQRQGIGKALYLALEEQAKAWGLCKLNLESTVSARTFYESVGYQPAGAPKPGFGIAHCHPHEKALQPNAAVA